LNRFVLDASIALAWVVDRPMDAYAREVQQKLGAGARALLPELWQLEVANGLAMAGRRKYLTTAELDAGVVTLENFLSTKAEIDSVFLSIRQARHLAESFQLTTYDAVYLELARREGLPLATLDKGLRAAAVKAGVALLK
jgi:predicted nucleic acid-binding protein